MADALALGTAKMPASKADGVGTVTFNKPPKRRAFTDKRPPAFQGG